MSAVPPATEPVAPVVAASRGDGPSWPRLWLPLAVAGLIGGGLGWWLVESYEFPFAAGEELTALTTKRMAMVPMSDEEVGRMNSLEADLDRRNATAAVGLLGAAVGAFAGLGGGLAARSIAGAVLGVVVGAVAGGFVGAPTGWLAAFLYQTIKIRFGLNAGYAALTAHALTWGLLAIPIGLAVYLSLRRFASIGSVVGCAVIGGIAAAVLHAGVFASFVFQMDNSDVIIPTGRWNRLAWIEIAMLAITALIAQAVVGSKRPATAPAVAAPDIA